jgi:hypothetical protein
MKASTPRSVSAWIRSISAPSWAELEEDGRETEAPGLGADELLKERSNGSWEPHPVDVQSAFR